MKWEESLLIINGISEEFFFCRKREFLLKRQEEPESQSLSRTGISDHHPLGFKVLQLLLCLGSVQSKNQVQVQVIKKKINSA